jgi:hypothetical protein
VAFAKTEDVAARLGRDLTEAEKTSYGTLLEFASAVIEEAVEKAEDAFTEVPKLLQMMAVELSLRGAANPKGIESTEKTLGQYSHAERYRAAQGADMLLSQTEELMLRRAVWGRTTTSQRVEGHIDDVFDALTGS